MHEQIEKIFFTDKAMDTLPYEVWQGPLWDIKRFLIALRANSNTRLGGQIAEVLADKADIDKLRAALSNIPNSHKRDFLFQGVRLTPKQQTYNALIESLL